ncbi:hypothetical protein Gasu2_19020 [Galdieria sulphuraria]|uniref:SAM domain-containing protein n=1 Tax=Galdieria sulphuraria TaxID=130081 RepID=M2WTJ6_GALSU|nr:uncharacterized protein Gasu_52060 [Galdieria sulphuraria]EME27225.1 hypothetical protein Gasu_52060 [Galdieria sulphuraria]GJD07547.1 hypothetical protein Gasu2_19020 [Galdieria sulphuraria]|eukprot:XP_005703745.1 hypothetical protein Gasu_52060 [Galdieria sulphuraria]
MIKGQPMKPNDDGCLCFAASYLLSTGRVFMKRYLWRRTNHGLLEWGWRTPSLSIRSSTNNSHPRHKSPRSIAKFLESDSENSNNKHLLWNPERPATSLLKYVLITAFIFVTFCALPFTLHALPFLLIWPVATVKMIFIPIFIGLGLFMGSYFILFSITALTFVSLTSLSFLLPLIVLFSFAVLLQSSKRNQNQNRVSIPKGNMVRDTNIENRDEWFETLHRRTQDELELFDNRLRQKTKPAELKLWTMEDILDELVSADLEEYITKFQEHRIDGRVLSQLTEKNLKDDLGIYKLGDRKRLMTLFRIRE